MMNVIQPEPRKKSVTRDLSRYSFGATSAIITSLALIVGLAGVANPRASIVGALLVLAFADNVSDSLGVHVYRESQFKDHIGNKIHTLSNFLTRLCITLLFAGLVLVLPIQYAVISSLAIGIILLSVLSYYIAIYHNASPLREIIEHLGIALIVLAASNFLGSAITKFFSA
jgi:vacuolar iron transporter family protein